MPNGALKDHLDAAWSELRNDMERARENGERAARALNLNGMKPRLPGGMIAAIDEVRKLYSEANDAAERVLIEHLGSSKERVERALDVGMAERDPEPDPGP